MKLFVDKRKYFPDPALPTLDGIVAMGDDLNVETLLEAYSFGIFPWPYPDLPCLWFCPDERGVIDFRELHISKSLEKFRRKTEMKITFNKNFTEVMQECSTVPRPGQSGTWITPPILKVYEEFHKQGYAHSVECWLNEKLVGGLYGVYVAGVFSGESMFYKESNASKLCLVTLIEKLREQGLTWMDIQMVTPVTDALGGKLVTKKEFLRRHNEAKLKCKPIVL
jgi:leucyl/phenylalanyl-tRNA---protein transferase